VSSEQNGRRRLGRCAQLRPGAEAEYDRLHAEVWPEVLAAIERAGIRNYSIFRHGRWLFSYFEIPVEVDLDEAMRYMLDDPACRRWETVVQALQELSAADPGQAAWVPMKEVFHLQGEIPAEDRRLQADRLLGCSV
jgi:L-rhamnose mutarotase